MTELASRLASGLKKELNKGELPAVAPEQAKSGVTADQVLELFQKAFTKHRGRLPLSDIIATIPADPIEVTDMYLTPRSLKEREIANRCRTYRFMCLENALGEAQKRLNKTGVKTAELMKIIDTINKLLKELSSLVKVQDIGDWTDYTGAVATTRKLFQEMTTEEYCAALAYIMFSLDGSKDLLTEEGKTLGASKEDEFITRAEANAKAEEQKNADIGLS